MLLLRWSYYTQLGSQPFAQSDWPAAVRALPPLQSDVYPYFNPSSPFQQNLWENATRAFPKAVGEAVAGDGPLLTPNPAQPFAQSDWPLLVRIALSLKSDVYGTLNSLLTPNPARPFAQNDWFQIQFTRPAKVDDVDNLLPSYFPNPAQPFSEDDWPLPYSYTNNYTKSVYGESFGLNQNFPPPAPSTLTKLFTVSGPSVSDIFPVVVGVVYHTINPVLPFETVSRRTATGSTVTDGELREDTSFELREDNSFELRDG